MDNVKSKFDLNDRVAIITGGGGLMGYYHAEAICEAGGIPVIWDINKDAIEVVVNNLKLKFNVDVLGISVDIGSRESIQNGFLKTLEKLNRIDILINNAANNPKMIAEKSPNWSRFENIDIEYWNNDLLVGLTGSFLCSQIIGTYFSKNNRGVILNIASDLGVIAPDQRIYRNPQVEESEQPVKPVTYSVVKHGIIGLTKYLATYWAEKNIRVNSLSPGGIYNGQSDDFVKKLTNLIPMQRMAKNDEYKAAVLFLISDASSYMTGSNLIIDGGRTTW